MEHFLEIISKPDNIPIVGMVVIVFYMAGWMLREGARNDRLIDEGQPEKVYERMNRWVWGEKEEEDE